MSHFQQRHEREQHRHQHSDRESLQDSRRGQPEFDPHDAGEVADERRNRGQHQGRERDAQHAARKAEQQNLGHVDGEHLSRAAPDALENGDAPHLLLDEHARDARHADAAENQHDQADEAQVVLGPRQVLTHLVLGAAIPAHVNELVGKRLPQLEDDLLRNRLGHAQQLLVRRAAAKPEQTGCVEIRAIDEYPWSQRECPEPAPGLGRDDAPDFECR